jgi:hypothetical protein
VTRVEDHDPFVGQDKESGVVVVVRLKPGANQHLRFAVREMIYLCGFDRSMYINVPNIGAVDVSLIIPVVQSTGIGKPTPGTLLRQSVDRNLTIGRLRIWSVPTPQKRRYNTDDTDDKKHFSHGEMILKKIKPDSCR